MANKRGAKTKTAKRQETIPILIRLCRADHELVKKRASMLGMNLSTFLRLPIRTGRIELDERKQKI
jgi:predicted DNA binding CopG/RHH family protein